MENGNGLWGSFHPLVQRLLFPNPSDNDDIFIFSPWMLKAEVSGFSYSVVDINLDGGLGAVTAQKTFYCSRLLWKKLLL